MVSPDHVVGSAAWKGADTYDDDDREDNQYYEREMSVFAKVKWSLLAARCSQLRGGLPCHFKDRYAAGTANMVRHVAFEDGRDLIARVRMPPLANGITKDDGEALAHRQLTNELSANKFLA